MRWERNVAKFQIFYIRPYKTESQMAKAENRWKIFPIQICHCIVCTHGLHTHTVFGALCGATMPTILYNTSGGLEMRPESLDVMATSNYIQIYIREQL